MIKIDTVEDYKAAKKTSTASVKTGTGGTIAVPCLETILVKTSLIMANTYNPNNVASDKMELLKESIVGNGFCFPVVTIWDDDLGMFVVIDGFHRSLIGGPGWLDMEYLPVVVLAHNISQRMIATHQFNKARGVHQVDLDADIIRALIDQGMAEQEIAAKLGIDEDSIHRYKQLTGIAELFKNADWSLSWDIENNDSKTPYEKRSKNGAK